MGDDWRAYCEKNGNGSYDPHRYDEAWLRRAIADLLLAGSGRSQSSRNSGVSSLAEELKAAQRDGSINSDSWRAYCDEHGDGSYDPHWYDARWLKRALADLRDGYRTDVQEHPVVLDIKEWQRSDIANTQAWRAYCEEHGDGTYNVSHYDEEFLKNALRDLRRGGNDRGRYQDAHTLELAETIKEWQRSDKANTEAWRAYCEEKGDGTYNVSHYDARFLKKALRDLTNDRWSNDSDNRGSNGASGGRLTERVKEVQRSSKHCTEAWRDFCIQKGDGTFDPSRYEATFLKAWLEKMEALEEKS